MLVVLLANSRVGLALVNGEVEVGAIDPSASMERVGSAALTELAQTVRAKLLAILARL